MKNKTFMNQKIGILYVNIKKILKLIKKIINGHDY